jgi:peptidoglycan/LPS O-acetylase OafA/YrhL
MKMPRMPTQSTALRVASVMAIVALALMMWSLVEPTPPPVLIALSVGQVIGTLSFAIFLWVVVVDYRARRLPP